MCRPNTQPRTTGAHSAFTISATNIEERRHSLTRKLKIPHYMRILSICICSLVKMLEMSVTVCVTQAKTAESDVPAEHTVKPAEHVQNTPQPEKVLTLQIDMM